jgi:hypothetical protein
MNRLLSIDSPSNGCDAQIGAIHERNTVHQAHSCDQSPVDPVDNRSCFLRCEFIENILLLGIEWTEASSIVVVDLMLIRFFNVGHGEDRWSARF